MYQRLYKNLTKQLIHRHQMFHVSAMFFIEQKPRKNKHYTTLVLMKCLNTKTKMVKNKLRNDKKKKKRGNIIWFNLPFSLSIKCTIGKKH